jgi:homoserine kinase
MRNTVWKITVPASTANLGPGFDSIGMAVNRYLHVSAALSDSWRFYSCSPSLEGIPDGKENLVYKAAAFLAYFYDKELPACEVEMKSDIPLARGLGSSSSAVVAGIELANQLLGLHLSRDEKVHWASLYEGHPDNVAPAICGGLVVASHNEGSTEVVHAGVPNIELVTLVPEEHLLTEKSRGILPPVIAHSLGVKGSAISNVMVAAIFQNNWELVGKMMEKDVYHQPYRMPLVPDLQDMMLYGKKWGAYGVALSGAGPTVICFAPVGKGKSLCERLQNRYPKYKCSILLPDSNGASLTTEVEMKKSLLG